MGQTHSPLRYPGGKSCLLPLITAILCENGLRLPHYAEPYAGGASLALALLFGGQVSDIHLNDVDAGIWSFWHSVLNDTDALVDLIETVNVTVPEWRTQREIYRKNDLSDPLKLGFATFFLNRTNRSGIIGTGGVIGGLTQEGNYKIDCRFNKDELTRRIKRIRKYKSRIHLTRLDALQFLQCDSGIFPKRTFLAIDPPYFAKGSSLYTSFYSPHDHADVAQAVLALDRPWILTYDAAAEISALYGERPQFLFDIKYSLQTKRTGSELLISSSDLKLPDVIRHKQVDHTTFCEAA
ncbi:MAG: DNA adenine methylase [Pseudomonadota bacterium]